MIRTIHFGRMIILRPEQYLVYSDVPRVEYDQTAKSKVPKPFEDYVPLDAPGTTLPTFRSWLLTLVEFDGDIRVYFRDIAQFIADDFDAAHQAASGFQASLRRIRRQGPPGQCIAH